MLTTAERSKIMTNFNILRAQVRGNKAVEQRLCRAFGDAQSNEPRRDVYRDPLTGFCLCPDCTYRPEIKGNCKHNLSQLLVTF